MRAQFMLLTPFCRSPRGLLAIGIGLLVSFLASVSMAGDPHLAFVTWMRDLVNVDRLHDGSAVVSPNGRQVAATRGYDFNIYTRTPGTGELDGPSLHSGLGKSGHPTVAAYSRDNRTLYVACDHPLALMIWHPAERPGSDDDWGSLLDPRAAHEQPGGPPPRGVPGLRQPRGIAISPDDKNLYVTSVAEGTLVVFSRDTKTGALTRLQTLQDNPSVAVSAGGPAPDAARLPEAIIVDGLSQARGVATSRDGQHVYVAGTGDRAVTTFRRDPADGKLAFVELLKENSTNGLGAPRHLAVSPDDRQIYVASGPEAVVVLARDTGSGRVTWRQTLRGGSGGVEGLENPQEVAASPRGDFVFVAAAGNQPDGSALTMFARDPKTGTLKFQHTLQAAAHPECRLGGLTSVCVSPDGRQVYTTSQQATVGVFAVRAK